MTSQQFRAASDANPNVSSEAQFEFDNLFAPSNRPNHHPDDKEDSDDDKLFEELDEEAQHIQKRITETMKLPVDMRSGISYHLPDESFDRGRKTGVKGIVADAREELRRMNKDYNGKDYKYYVSPEEEQEIRQLREQRKGEIRARRERDENDIRNRKVREEFGTLEVVDAVRLDEILKNASRQEIVAIFISDDASELSHWFLQALLPLIPANPHVHFVKVDRHHLDFEAAGVPAVVAFSKERGDAPFANLTPLEEYMPDDVELDEDVLGEILRKHEVLA